MITSTTPTMPDGKTPQEREYPQFGRAPMRIRMRTTMRMVLSIWVYFGRSSLKLG